MRCDQEVKSFCDESTLQHVNDACLRQRNVEHYASMVANGQRIFERGTYVATEKFGGDTDKNKAKGKQG